MIVRVRQLQPGDVIEWSGEVVVKVSRGKLTPKYAHDVWFENRLAVWKSSRPIRIKRHEGNARGNMARQSHMQSVAHQHMVD